MPCSMSTSEQWVGVVVLIWHLMMNFSLLRAWGMTSSTINWKALVFFQTFFRPLGFHVMKLLNVWYILFSSVPMLYESMRFLKSFWNAEVSTVIMQVVCGYQVHNFYLSKCIICDTETALPWPSSSRTMLTLLLFVLSLMVNALPADRLVPALDALCIPILTPLQVWNPFNHISAYLCF